jgi:Flp pilus assembly protein TadD
MQMSLLSHVWHRRVDAASVSFVGKITAWKVVSVVCFALASYSKAAIVSSLVLFVVIDAALFFSHAKQQVSSLKFVMVSAVQHVPHIGVALAAVRSAVGATAGMGDINCGRPNCTTTVSEDVLRACYALVFYVQKTFLPSGLTLRNVLPRDFEKVEYLAPAVIVACVSCYAAWCLLARNPQQDAVRREVRTKQLTDFYAKHNPEKTKQDAASILSSASIDDTMRSLKERYGEVPEGWSGDADVTTAPVWVASMAWAAYIAVLLPTLGLLSNHVTLMASDRYSYIPAMFIWVPVVAAGVRVAGARVPKSVILAVTGAAAAALVAKTQETAVCFSSSSALWTQVLRVNPADAMGHINLGVEFENGGDYANALTHYKTGSRLDPKAEAPCTGLGTLLGRQGKMREAEIWFKKALKNKPNGESPHMNFGVMLHQQQRLAEAKHHLAQGTRLKPNDPFGQTVLGVVQDQLGEPAAALKSMKKALALDPAFDMAVSNMRAFKAAHPDFN